MKNFGRLVKDAIIEYLKLNKALPDLIIFYRGFEFFLNIKKIKILISNLKMVFMICKLMKFCNKMFYNV